MTYSLRRPFDDPGHILHHGHILGCRWPGCRHPGTCEGTHVLPQGYRPPSHVPPSIVAAARSALEGGLRRG